MMKSILAAFLLIFLLSNASSLSAQNCSIYPNTQTLIAQNGVKRQTIICADKFKREKYVLEVIFFDSLGNCFKKVSRDPSGNSKTYSYTTWSTDGNLKEQFYESGYYDKDSNEVMSDKQIFHYDKQGRAIEQIHLMKNDSSYTTFVTEFTYSANGKRSDAFDFQLNAKGDTIQKTIHNNNDSIQSTAIFIRTKGKWVEKSKQVYTSNKKQHQQSFEEYEFGKLKSKTTWKYVYDDKGNLKEESQYDLHNKLTQKTIYNGKCRDISIYVNGKLTNTSTDCNPYNNPLDRSDNSFSIPSQTPTPPLDTISRKPISTKPKTKPHFTPRSVTTYLDPETKLQAGMVEDYDETGLIVKRNVMWDGKIYTWEYVFY